MKPNVGRFVTMDTFAERNREPLSLHKYLYAHANPIRSSAGRRKFWDFQFSNRRIMRSFWANHDRCKAIDHVGILTFVYVRDPEGNMIEIQA